MTVGSRPPATPKTADATTAAAAAAAGATAAAAAAVQAIAVEVAGPRATTTRHTDPTTEKLTQKIQHTHS